MIRLEILVLAISTKLNAAFEPNSKAFELRNPLLLKTYRPEKKQDSDHYRLFGTFMGGFKAGLADVVAKTNGESNRLNDLNTLRDLMHLYGVHTDLSFRPVILYLRKSLNDSGIDADTPISYFKETPKKEGAMNA